MPVALGEVAAGVIKGRIYVVGEGDSATLGYDSRDGEWTRLARRPFQGHHHVAEVYRGKLYLLGGLGSGAGKVQIYDPVADEWTVGADMPFAAGSVSTALIRGKIYVAGGIVGSRTTDQVARYNVAKNVWKVLPAMPAGRNHAASGRDGRYFYVFGGRGPGSGDANYVANGFDTVQRYDPVKNRWTIRRPLPQARGGMGKAVFLDGELYVRGGETATGAGATEHRVYSRVDIYNPATNKWRKGRAMATARHGIFPVRLKGDIYIPGGGVHAGASKSDVMEVYRV